MFSIYMYVGTVWLGLCSFCIEFVGENLLHLARFNRRYTIWCPIWKRGTFLWVQQIVNGLEREPMMVP